MSSGIFIVRLEIQYHTHLCNIDFINHKFHQPKHTYMLCNVCFHDLLLCFVYILICHYLRGIMGMGNTVCLTLHINDIVYYCKMYNK